MDQDTKIKVFNSKDKEIIKFNRITILLDIGLRDLLLTQ